jgi:hypothetical protein
MLITAALWIGFFPLIMVMAWRCWNLRPVPVIRIWSLSFGAMTLAMLGQASMCQYWRAKFVKCQAGVSQSLQQQRQQIPISSSIECPCSHPTSACLASLRRCDGVLCAPQVAASQFHGATTPFDSCKLSPLQYLQAEQCLEIHRKNRRDTPLGCQSKDPLSYLALYQRTLARTLLAQPQAAISAGLVSNYQNQSEATPFDFI